MREAELVLLVLMLAVGGLQGPGVLSICAGSEVSPDRVEQAQAFGIMRLPNTPDHDGGQDPVGEHQPPVGVGSASAAAWVAVASVQGALCATVHGSSSSPGVAGLRDEGDNGGPVRALR